MLFNSFDFLLFFPLVTTLFFLLPHRVRWMLLLVASCYFYMYFKPIYIVILAFTIVIDYFVGINLVNLTGKKRKWLLVASIIANVGILVVFKYYNFFAGNVNEILAVGNMGYQFSLLNILLPIGLSFHTFQAMSYTIEVYRGNQQPEKHFGIYALYVMFYPQLVAGPIERPQNMLHQFHEKKIFSSKNLSEGLTLMLWGYFKKVMVADRLSVYVDSAFSNYQNQSGSTLLLAIFFFSIQIYCDFSGYSDIALGSAKAMGFDLMVNFRRPYLATNINDFWRRWHISLSTWFKDYVYFPLGGSRVSPIKKFRNRMIVFLLSGIWHGANWTFVVWGAIHGVVSGVYNAVITKEKINSQNVFKNTLSIAATFILVSFAWLFFRADSVSQAFKIIKIIATSGWRSPYLKTGNWAAISFFAIAIVLLNDLCNEKFPKIRLLNSKNFVTKLSFTLLLVFAILLFGTFRNNNFIYFQF